VREKPKCPKCGSNYVYIRVKTGEIVCRRCGAISKVKKHG